MKRIAFASALILLSAQQALAVCDFRSADFTDELRNPAEIKAIHVEITNSRKWFQNSFKIITSKSEVIRQKYKDKLDATLEVEYSFGSCIYAARVRQSGDLKDHIAFVEGNPVSSLDVKLKEGNIASSVRFKLLLPESRNGEKEVFGALLFRELNFISPKTFFVNSTVNGVKTRYLFQENAVKELLEANYRREGPLLEGDESILWDDGPQGFVARQKHAGARLSNDKWAAKGFASLQIASKALTRLQPSYLDFANHAGERYGYLNPNRNTPLSRLFSDYHIMLLASGGLHATSPNNRKFYFNSFLDAFEPIYFDGMFEFKSNSLAQASKQLPQDVALILQDTKVSEISDLKDRVLGIDRAAFATVYANATGFSLSKAVKTVEEYLGNVASQLTALEAIKKSPPNLPSQQDSFEQTLLKFAKGSNSETQKQALFSVAGKREDGTISLVCLIDSVCKDQSLSHADYIRLMSENLLGKNRALLVAEKTYGADEANFTSTETPLGPILHSSGAQVLFSTEARKLEFLQNEPDDWFLMAGMDVADWEIKLIGKPSEPSTQDSTQRFNQYGLTGCLNFYDVTFSGPTISAADGQCEDSVNIVSSRGDVAALAVSTAFADAVDIDFSVLSLSRVVVEKAGNDCFDVSSGAYTLQFLSANFCGDKGISVGEASTFDAQSADIENSVIAVSSKDSSSVKIGALKGLNVDVCLEAIQKKQEFGGAEIDIGKLSCDGDLNQDEHSNIRFERSGT